MMAIAVSRKNMSGPSVLHKVHNHAPNFLFELSKANIFLLALHHVVDFERTVTTFEHVAGIYVCKMEDYLAKMVLGTKPMVVLYEREAS